MNWINALHLIKLLDENHVKILDNHRALGVTESGVDVANQKGEKSSLAADTIIIARGMKSTDGSFEESLKDIVQEVYNIGDCIEPRRVMEAIWEGYRKARLV
jgi:thioredoxin reductase